MKKRGQVWVETVIYTLIILVLIGVVLAYAKPKIEEMQDKIIVENTVKIMEEIDNLVRIIVQGGPANKRIIDIIIKEGTLNIDGVNNKLFFELEGRYAYTEPGQEVAVRELIALTERRGDFHKVTLTRDYSEYDLKYNEEDIKKSLNGDIKLSIQNKGKDEFGGKTIIEMNVI